MDLLLYLCATVSLLAIFIFGLAPLTMNGRLLPPATFARVLISLLAGAVIFVISVGGGYYLALFAVLLLATLALAIKRATGEDTAYERSSIIMLFTILSYLGPTLLFAGILWIFAPRLPQEQRAEVLRAFPSIYAKRVGYASFIDILESKVSNESFPDLKKVYDFYYPRRSSQPGPSFSKVLETRNSACHIADLLKSWDLKTLDTKSKIYLLQLAKSHNFECGIFDQVSKLSPQ